MSEWHAYLSLLQPAYLSSSLPLWAWSPGTRGRRVASVLHHLVIGTDFYQVSQRGLGPSVTAGECFKRENANVRGGHVRKSNHDSYLHAKNSSHAGMLLLKMQQLSLLQFYVLCTMVLSEFGLSLQGLKLLP